MLTREQYHQRRLAKALAQVCQNFYDIYGDADEWPKWAFEEEEQAKKKVKEQICKEDGFAQGE